MTISNFTIRQGQSTDLVVLQKLFTDTVNTVCKTDYSAQQIKVWTSSVENTQRRLDIIESQYLLIAQKQDKIVGFCSLDKNNYIDLLYVHKDKQGLGIARQLYFEIEMEAVRRGQTQLISDVSITARPFFEKVGFTVQSKQTVLRQGVELINFKMTKELK